MIVRARKMRTSAIRVNIEAIKADLATRMAYRADFFISTIIMMVSELIFPLVTFAIYRSGASFPGWGLYEILVIQSIFLMAKGIAGPFFFGMIWNTLNRVRDGTFDLLLIKPRSILFMTIATGIDMEDLGKLAGGIAIFILAILHLPPPSLWQWLQFVILFVLSLVVLFSCSLLMSGSVFKWVGNSRVYEIFDAVTAFGLYPRTVFSKSFQVVISFVLPIAMIGFFPAAVLLGKPAAGVLIASMVCILFLIFCLWFWYKMLGKYTSAGG